MSPNGTRAHFGFALPVEPVAQKWSIPSNVESARGSDMTAPNESMEPTGSAVSATSLWGDN